MSMSRLVITAVTVEGRSKSEVARDYGISRVWVQKLVHRFDDEGAAAFEPRSRRPRSSPHAVEADTEDAIIRLRKELSKQGLDAGAETIAAHLARQAPPGGGRPAIPAVSTIWRVLSRRGFVNPQPQKRPRSSWKSFCADQPNERWQTDITHWQLADGTEVSPVVMWSLASAKPLPGGESRPGCSATMGRSSPPNSAARDGSPWKSNSVC